MQEFGRYGGVGEITRARPIIAPHIGGIAANIYYSKTKYNPLHDIVPVRIIVTSKKGFRDEAEWEELRYRIPYGVDKATGAPCAFRPGRVISMGHRPQWSPPALAGVGH